LTLFDDLYYWQNVKVGVGFSLSLAQLHSLFEHLSFIFTSIAASQRASAESMNDVLVYLPSAADMQFVEQLIMLDS
jgi:hypothetical protein